MKVTAPDGTRWKVGRQWWPERGNRDYDGGDFPVDAGPGGGDGWLLPAAVPPPWTSAPARSAAHRWHVVGFRNSGERRDEVAAALGSGRALPSASPLPR